jgi:hypothetical protein
MKKPLACGLSNIGYEMGELAEKNVAFHESWPHFLLVIRPAQ